MSNPPDDELAKIRQRADLCPTDLRLRFELGVALSKRHDYVAAIPELQKAMMSPQVRLKAMSLLADAFDAKGLNQSATSMREMLARESGDDGDSGSAPVPVPTQPIRPQDSSSARKIPDEDDHYA